MRTFRVVQSAQEASCRSPFLQSVFQIKKGGVVSDEEVANPRCRLNGARDEQHLMANHIHQTMWRGSEKNNFSFSRSELETASQMIANNWDSSSGAGLTEIVTHEAPNDETTSRRSSGSNISVTNSRRRKTGVSKAHYRSQLELRKRK